MDRGNKSDFSTFLGNTKPLLLEMRFYLSVVHIHVLLGSSRVHEANFEENLLNWFIMLINLLKSVRKVSATIFVKLLSS